jgi:hypothetical protein
MSSAPSGPTGANPYTSFSPILWSDGIVRDSASTGDGRAGIAGLDDPECHVRYVS